MMGPVDSSSTGTENAATGARVPGTQRSLVTSYSIKSRVDIFTRRGIAVVYAITIAASTAAVDHSVSGPGHLQSSIA
jgi:hypothetical protein